jgi:DNA-binding GntR family transcriptional regulator
VVVARLIPQDVLDTYLVLALVAEVLAERAATSLSDADHAELERLHVAMQQSTVDFDTLDRLNWAFHRVINRASRSPRMLSVLRALSLSVPRHFYHIVPNWADIANEQHAQLLAALRARDANLASSLAREHVQAGGTVLVEHLTQQGFWSELAPVLAGDARTNLAPPAPNGGADRITTQARTLRAVGPRRRAESRGRDQS